MAEKLLLDPFVKNQNLVYISLNQCYIAMYVFFLLFAKFRTIETD